MEGAGKGSPSPSLSSRLCPSPMDSLAGMALQASCSQMGRCGEEPGLALLSRVFQAASLIQRTLDPVSLSAAPSSRACLTPTLLLTMGEGVMLGKVQRPKYEPQEAGGSGLGAGHKTRGVQVQREAEGHRAREGPGASWVELNAQQ